MTDDVFDHGEPKVLSGVKRRVSHAGPRIGALCAWRLGIMSPGYVEINLEYAYTRKETGFPRQVSVGMPAIEAIELAEALLELAREEPVNEN